MPDIIFCARLTHKFLLMKFLLNLFKFIFVLLVIIITIVASLWLFRPNIIQANPIFQNFYNNFTSGPQLNLKEEGKILGDQVDLITDPSQRIAPSPNTPVDQAEFNKDYLLMINGDKDLSWIMNISRQNENLNGYYYDTKVGQKILLNGLVYADSSWILEEKEDSSENSFATAKVTFYGDSNLIFEGLRLEKNSKEIKKIKAKEISQDYSFLDNNKNFNKAFFEHIIEAEETEAYAISASYPQLNFSEKSQFQDLINSQIWPFDLEQIKLKSTIETRSFRENCNSEIQNCEQKGFFKFDYFIHYNQNQIISLSQESSQSLPTETSLSTEIRTYNYDLFNERIIELNDLTENNLQDQVLTFLANSQEGFSKSDFEITGFVLNGLSLTIFIKNTTTQKLNTLNYAISDLPSPTKILTRITNSLAS